MSTEASTSESPKNGASVARYCKKCQTETHRLKNGDCKVCSQRRSAEWQKANKDKVNANSAKWRLENPEKRKATANASAARYRAKAKVASSAKTKIARERPHKPLLIHQGDKFSQLTAVEYLGGGKWNCVCDCGGSTTTKTNHLRSGHTRSCGCVKGTHKQSKSKEYIAWRHMKARVGSQYYEHVSVCQEWVNSFEKFYECLGPSPGKDFSVDRIDVTKGYEPNNCRWASKMTQTVNRGINQNNTSGVKGVSFDKSRGKWVSQIGLQYRTISQRFDSFDDAVAHRTTLFNDFHAEYL